MAQRGRRARGVPEASSVSARLRMQNTKRRDTPPELAIRRLVHRQGFRYRVDAPVLPGLRRRADMVFRTERVAVYVDGCFWHSCPLHATTPKTNRAWWTEKLRANRARDRDTDRRLSADGWVVLRFWAHEDPVRAAAKVARTVLQRRVLPPS